MLRPGWRSLALSALVAGCTNQRLHLPPPPHPDDAAGGGGQADAPFPDDGPLPDASPGDSWQSADVGAGDVDHDTGADTGSSDDAGSRNDDGGSSNDDGSSSDDAGGSDATEIAVPNLLTQERWLTRVGDFQDGQKWLAGDFNGDGRADLANVFNDEGQVSVDIYLSTGSTLLLERWMTRRGGFWDTQKWLAGDFDGNGLTDLAYVFDDLGLATIDVLRSNGRTFGSELWVTRRGGYWDAQKWLAGDFDGDRRTDLVYLFDDLGLATIDVRRSTGTTFTSEVWVARQGGFWNTQKWLVGDFDGNQKADLANVFDDNSRASIDIRRQDHR